MMVVKDLSNALLTLKHVTKGFNDRTVLSDISLQIKRGDSIIIMGSNGSGKSTLLRLISGLIPVTAGERLIDSTGIVLGYAPDRMPKLKMTSTEYLTHMGRIAHISKQQLQARIDELHSLFQLEQSTIKMTQFSKGMLQKVNIMQATLNRPDLVVLDEPFSGLDKPSAEHLVSSLQAIQEEGASIVAAVHDPLLASQLDSTIYFIRQGKLSEEPMTDAASFNEISFEIVCYVEEELQEQLASQFPEAVFQSSDENRIIITIQKKDYNDFMTELLKNGIELFSLQRKVG
ncbi:ATP-binding cassette domain-containing protein [Paenibacillus camelliae]|uniref:ATP-binding cassette domain-containing protein n=1 Tax=Paenibacillus camelliae TaxID=512410 RepID=UPI00203C2AD8|nr:ABC transporter ATP-binding protein [Paenibacillus camelliae]MCM3632342.1 ABC transporter ATP-binding protein [Paenibacillus camelliae]